MYLQNASCELRNPPGVPWATIMQEALVVGLFMLGCWFFV